MNKKIIFWVIIAVLITVIAVLLQFTPDIDGSTLVIEKKDGETVEMAMEDILRLEGITFPTADPVISQFYEKYKKDSLVKVFYVQQFLHTEDFAGLIFHSTDGARVLIENEPIILITLEKQNKDYSLRLIIPGDSFSQRWLKNVCRITIHEN